MRNRVSDIYISDMCSMCYLLWKAGIKGFWGSANNVEFCWVDCGDMCVGGGGEGK